MTEVTKINKEKKKRPSKFPFRSVLILLFVAQLCGASYSIWQQYRTKNQGEAFLFQTKPIDPRDPFRGQYVALSFEVEKYYPFSGCKDNKGYYPDGSLYASLQKDDKGVASITQLTEKKPKGAYLKIDRKWCGYEYNLGKIKVSLPFARYYANENEALGLENQARANPKATFLKVWVNDGEYSVDELILPKK